MLKRLDDEAKNKLREEWWNHPSTQSKPRRYEDLIDRVARKAEYERDKEWLELLKSKNVIAFGKKQSNNMGLLLTMEDWQELEEGVK